MAEDIIAGHPLLMTTAVLSGECIIIDIMIFKKLIQKTVLN
jgi:hypothetical protein